jgi:hypothetical protein
MDDLFRRKFQGKMDFLVEKLDVDNGLLPKLMDVRILTYRQVEAIKAYPTPSQRIEKLIELLVRCPDACFEKFLQAIRVNGQGFIADWLQEDAVNLPHPVQNAE